MPMVKLSLASLEELDDGRVSKAFVHELRRAVMDCADRPGDKNARTVTLAVKLKPIVAEEGLADEAEAEFQIKSKVPDRKSKTYSFRVQKNGDLVYSTNSPTNVNQATIFDGDVK